MKSAFPGQLRFAAVHSVRVLRRAGVDAYGLTFTQTNMQSGSGIKTISDYGAAPPVRAIDQDPLAGEHPLLFHRQTP